MENERTQVALGVVRNKDKKVLIVLRKKIESGTNNVKLTWVYPGGSVEKNETKERAAEREVLEESGYKVRAGEVISEKPHPEFPVYIYYVECSLENAEPDGKVNEDIQSIKWVEPKDLPNYFTTNIDQKVLSYLLKTT